MLSKIKEFLNISDSFLSVLLKTSTKALDNPNKNLERKICNLYTFIMNCKEYNISQNDAFLLLKTSSMDKPVLHLILNNDNIKEQIKNVITEFKKNQSYLLVSKTNIKAIREMALNIYKEYPRDLSWTRGVGEIEESDRVTLAYIKAANIVLDLKLDIEYYKNIGSGTYDKA